MRSSVRTAASSETRSPRARYRFDGPGARPDAVDQFRTQLAASPRAAVDPADVERLRGFGLGDATDLVRAARV